MPLVALVEDESITRRLLLSVLRQAGFKVEVYERGDDALARLEASPPDLLVTDVDLPGLSGLELTARLRCRHSFPILILSGLSGPEDFERGFQAGADDYLRKPLLPAELVAKVRRLLDRSGPRTRVPAQRLEPGQSVGRFVVEEWLASGGYGEVYRVRDPQGQVRALKLLRGPSADPEENRLRFLREAYALAAVEHPNLAELVEVGGDSESLFYTMEFVEGPTLALAPRARTLGQALNLLAPLAAVLQQFEARGLVHRDLKPSNIILRDGRWEEPVLIDFGLAKRARDESLTVSLEVLGTPGFLPPEATRGDPVDIRGDVFALGVVAVYAITGRLPFPDLTGFRLAMHMQRVPIELPAWLPEPLASLLRDMTALDPSQRPRPGELLERVQSLTSLADQELAPAADQDAPTRRWSAIRAG